MSAELHTLLSTGAKVGPHFHPELKGHPLWAHCSPLSGTSLGLDHQVRMCRELPEPQGPGCTPDKAISISVGGTQVTEFAESRGSIFMWSASPSAGISRKSEVTVGIMRMLSA